MVAVGVAIGVELATGVGLATGVLLAGGRGVSVGGNGVAVLATTRAATRAVGVASACEVVLFGLTSRTRAVSAMSATATAAGAIILLFTGRLGRCILI